MQGEEDECKQRVSIGVKLRSLEKLQLHSEEKWYENVSAEYKWWNDCLGLHKNFEDMRHKMAKVFAEAEISV